jgi:hypothetical protein
LLFQTKEGKAVKQQRGVNLTDIGVSIQMTDMNNNINNNIKNNKQKQHFVLKNYFKEIFFSFFDLFQFFFVFFVRLQIKSKKRNRI